MRRYKDGCLLCKKVVYIGDKLAIIQVLRFLELMLQVSVMIVCYDCGIRIGKEIELLKKEVA